MKKVSIGKVDMGEEKRRIYLVGPCRLQNELMALHIQEKTGIRCAVAELPLGSGDLRPHTAGGKCLILCDCQGSCLEELTELFASDFVEVPRRIYLALFNLRPDAELEKPALDLGVRGFFYKDDSAEILMRGVEAIFQGEFWASRSQWMEKVPYFRKSREVDREPSRR